jgi:uncharacterized protein
MRLKLKEYQKSLYWFFWLALFNLGLIQIAAVMYFSTVQQLPETPWAWAFLFAYWCGHFFSLVMIFYLIWGLFLFLLPQTLLQPSIQRWILSTIGAAVVLWLIVDTIVYAQYRFHINFLILDLYFHSNGQVISFAWQSWAKIAAVGVGLFLAELGFTYWITPRIEFLRSHKMARKVFLVYFSLFVLAHLGYIWGDAIFYSPITRLGFVFPFSAPAQAQSFLAKHGFVDVEEYKKRRAMRVGLTHKKLHYPIAPVVCEAREKKLNVIWILADALRADVLNEKVMPNSYELSRSSQVFLNHYSGSNTTRYGVFNLFYGIAGVYFDAALNDNVSPVFVDELQKQGYEFGIFGSAPLSKPEFDQTVFTKIRNLRILSKADHDYDRDKEITSLFIDFLNKRDTQKPFFGFMFYDSTHGYSSPPDYPKKFQPVWANVDYLKLNNATEEQPMFNMYKNSANFIDGLIGRVTAELKKKSLLENTIVLISSDHGQEFNDNHLNYWGHNSNYSDAQTHVPLVIYWPGRAFQEFTNRSDHYDVVPTFMHDVLGCKTESRQYSSGDDLFEKNSHSWIIMGRRDDFAVYRDHDIVVVNPAGDYEIVDHTYHPVKEAHLDGASILPALEELRRFF